MFPGPLVFFQKKRRKRVSWFCGSVPTLSFSLGGEKNLPLFYFPLPPSPPLKSLSPPPLSCHRKGRRELEERGGRGALTKRPRTYTAGQKKKGSRVDDGSFHREKPNCYVSAVFAGKGIRAFLAKLSPSFSVCFRYSYWQKMNRTDRTSDCSEEVESRQATQI